MKKKKIAIVLFGDYLKDGRVQRTAEALSEEYDVKVFVTTDDMVNYPSIYHEISLRMTPLKTKKLPNHPIVQVLKFFEYFIVTIIQIHKYNPDIIFCNDVYTLIFGWWFKKRKKKFIYDSHELWKDTMHHYAYNAKLFKILYWLQKKTICKTDAVITVNDSIADILTKDHNIKRPLVIMNINRINLSEVTKEDIIRKEFLIDQSKKIVLYIGGIAIGRGLEYIVESVQYWDDDIFFAILGSGAFELELKEITKNYSLEEKVYFLGSVQQDEVLQYAIACDAGIIAYQPSCKNHYYCLPNKVFQYAQMKKPILSSNFPELSKLINGYSLGATFDPISPIDIAKTVNDLFSKNFQISQDNHQKFIAKYNWENEAKKLLKLLKSVDG